MILASIPYSLNILQVFYISTGYIIFSSILLGVAAPLLWTALGTFLANNSDLRTVNRNSGVFWAIHQSSIFIGSYFAYHLIRTSEYIEHGARSELAYVLIFLSLAGTFLMIFLRRMPWIQQRKLCFKDGIRNTFRLMRSKQMGLLSMTMFYTGLHQVIWNGVHTTCVGLTVDFGENRKSIAALGGVFFGIGEVIGGIIFGFIGGITAKKGREPIIIIGFVTSGVAYFLMFLNLPPASPIRETLPGETGYR